MIVPYIKLANDLSIESFPEWIEKINSFGLFGRVALGVNDRIDCELLEKMVIETGGSLDVQILLETFQEELGMNLLNAGADQILVRAAVKISLIPEDRIRVIENFAEWTADQPAIIDIELIAQTWKTGQDHLVDVRLLKSPATLADALIPLLVSDRPDGLWPTVIVDQLGIALGLAYSSEASLRIAIEKQTGVYFSRSRDKIWEKGKTSGAIQRLVGVRVDCDFDTLRFMVAQQAPGFCHNGTHTCFGYERNVSEIIQRLEDRIQGGDRKSFTKKLFDDQEMLRKKLLEEAQELSDATTTSDATWEAADVLYFSLIALLRNGATLPKVYSELGRRMQRVVRRKNKLEP
ncbi:phosphoribosyl-ATP diphosphatase [bacterium]|nr:phosphoribosyl-ATP diphosphatase [bacterium]